MRNWLSRVETHRLALFAVVGGFNTAVCYALFATLVRGFAWHHNYALLADYGFGAVLGFSLHRLATFGDRTELRQPLPKYLLSLVIMFTLDLGTLNLLVAAGLLGPLVAQAVAIGLVTTASYLLQKHWVFRSHAVPPILVPAVDEYRRAA